jgi:hypothetical protein
MDIIQCEPPFSAVKCKIATIPHSLKSKDSRWTLPQDGNLIKKHFALKKPGFKKFLKEKRLD